MADTPQNQAAKPLSRIAEYDVMIRESHLDTFGHVNNAVYLALFEEARWDIIDSNGYGLKKVQETGIGPTILDIHLQFKRELRNREKIVIKTWVSESKGKIQTLRQVMVNSQGEEACIADFVVGLFDTRSRKIIAPTPEWIQAIGLL